MVFTKRLREGIRRGRIRCTVRIWQRLQVKVGGRYPMDEGHVVVDAITPIEESDITDDLARESGFSDAKDLLKIARHGRGQNVYLIRFHYLAPGAWETKPSATIRPLLSGGDRRSIAESRRARVLIERDPSLVSELVALTADTDWLVAQRALDLLEKLAREHADWIERHKNVFIGPLAASDKWEIRLQIVRALPLFHWSQAQERRVEEILLENVRFPQTFVRAWALDGLATLAERRADLMPVVRRHLRAFERSSSKALQARARQIRARL
jgi:hypothetical protein